jgi:hypothetical protein
LVQVKYCSPPSDVQTLLAFWAEKMLRTLNLRYLDRTAVLLTLNSTSGVWGQVRPRTLARELFTARVQLTALADSSTLKLSVPLEERVYYILPIVPPGNNMLGIQYI